MVTLESQASDAGSESAFVYPEIGPREPRPWWRRKDEEPWLRTEGLGGRKSMGGHSSTQGGIREERTRHSRRFAKRSLKEGENRKDENHLLVGEHEASHLTVKTRGGSPCCQKREGGPSFFDHYDHKQISLSRKTRNRTQETARRGVPSKDKRKPSRRLREGKKTESAHHAGGRV